MVTRSKDGIFQPRVLLAQQPSVTEPIHLRDALSNKNWHNAMCEEYAALIRNNTWSLVHAPPNASIVGCKWVFKLKTNSDGSIIRHKARLVAKGYSQQAGFDFFETFSPVVKPTTIRLVLTIAITKRWPIHQLDVNNAFLNGSLTEVIHMQQPPGFEQKQGTAPLVCRLHKAIYGLKQAPRAWFDKLRSALQHMGFSASKADSSLFVHSSSTLIIYILVYVDDIIITGSDSTQIATLIHKLDSQFSLKNLGDLSYFLGVQVSKLSDGSLFHSQSKYVQDLMLKTKWMVPNLFQLR